MVLGLDGRRLVYEGIRFYDPKLATRSGNLEQIEVDLINCGSARCYVR